MHITEFKAWFDGFTEEMKGPPNKDQWAKIKKQVKQISEQYTPLPLFIDRYYPRPWRRYWDYEPYWVSSCVTDKTTTSTSDWISAGKAEYRAMASTT